MHPNDVAAPEIANVAWIVSPAAHTPMQAAVRPANPSIRLNIFKYHRPPKSPCHSTCQRSQHRRSQRNICTLFQRDHSFQVSIRPLLPFPGLYVVSSIMASVITWYQNQSRGGNVNVNCIIATATMRPPIAWICGIAELTTNAGKSFLIRKNTSQSSPSTNRSPSKRSRALIACVDNHDSLKKPKCPIPDQTNLPLKLMSRGPLKLSSITLM